MKEISAFLKDAGAFLGLSPEVVAVALFMLPVAYWRYSYHSKTLEGKGGRNVVRDRLQRHGSYRDAYFLHLRLSLEWLDSKLGASAWSAQSYDFTLRMAFVYPFASLFIIWMFTGQNTSGIERLLRDDASPMLRVLTVALTSALAATYYLLPAKPWE